MFAYALASNTCSQATDRAIGTFAFLFVLKSASYLLMKIEKNTTGRV
jgi:hypothetical protein